MERRASMKIKDTKTGMTYEIPTIEEGKTLLALLRKRQVFLDAPCNGRGSCGKCKIKFLSGAPKVTEKERRLLTEEELSAGIRLTCSTVPTEDCTIAHAADGRDGAKTKQDRCDETMQAVAGEHQRDSQMPEKSAKASDAQTLQLGVAIDIGTTTLAASLLDMNTGKELAVATGINHQRSYGADVISRIEAANAGFAGELQESIRKDLEQLIGNLMAKLPRAADSAEAKKENLLIRKVVIAGNNTMCHLLLGLSCEKLGEAPFEPEDISMQRRYWNGTDIVILPGISAFVGADIVAGIYANDLTEHEETAMLLDVGTNGEMVIGNKQGLLVTSTAAGPVFEGGNISCGVAGISGAVSHVKITMDSGRKCDISYETIENIAPVGLCGSAVLDTVSELFHNRIVDETGLLQEPWFETGIEIARIASGGNDICLTQKDIREVQMAKGAIRTGIELLQEAYGNHDAVNKIYLAGGFGYFMNVDSAIGIGMFPAEFQNRIQSVGNSSLDGAKRFLLEDTTENSRAESQVKKIVSLSREINLAMHPDFNDRYMEAMNLDY
jgi:uncharacterized 2Fe-2S/4Fe-4S cluster protein (DUF4445 family)